MRIAQREFNMVNLHPDLVALYKMRSGSPLAGQQTFWRMLYFSAVTITTLGYGDIIPVTHTARILVGFESVLGIVVIGFF